MPGRQHEVKTAWDPHRNGKAVVTTMGAAAGNCTGAGSAAMSEKSPNVAADSAASAAENAAVATEKAAAVAAYTQTHADGF